MSGNTSRGVFSVKSPRNPMIDTKVTIKIIKIGTKYLIYSIGSRITDTDLPPNSLRKDSVSTSSN